MKPGNFKKIFLEKMSKNEFLKINKKDLLSEGILDSLDIVILSTKIRKIFKINIKINSQKTINIFRSYKEILKYIKKSY